MVNDLPKVVKPVSCVLLADDLKMYSSTYDFSSFKKLQRYVDGVTELTTDNNLNFNVNKCSIMCYTREKQPLIDSIPWVVKVATSCSDLSLSVI